MRGAWEWRGFWAAEKNSDIEALASAIAERIGAGVNKLAAVHDVYLVIPEMAHNLKIRRGALELKVLRQRLPHGFCMFEDKQAWPFPIAAKDTARIALWLPDRCRPPIVPFRSADELLLHLKEREPSLTLVPVAKQRVRLRRGRVRLELARLELPGGVHLLSACADGCALDKVRELVRSSRLPIQARAMSYVELLQNGGWSCMGVSASDQAAA